jgi:hypothetical protein
MGNVLFGWPVFSDVSDFATPVLSGGSWQSALPLANLQDRRLGKLARSADDALTSTIIKADLGLVRAVRVVALPKHNFSTAATWRVRGLGAEPIVEDNNFSGGWTNVGTPIVTTGQADPFGGTRATLIEDDDAITAEGKYRAIGFTGDGVKAIAITVKEGTVNDLDFGVRDNDAGLVWRHRIRATWSGGVPTLATIEGSGTLYTPIALGGGWYQCYVLVNGVVGANDNRFYVYPGISGTGSIYFYEAMAWNLTTQPILDDSGVVAAWPAALSAEDAQDMNVPTLYVPASAVSARYWRIEIADTANPDGYVDLGRLVIAGGWQASMNPAYGMRMGWETSTSREETDGGAAVYTERPRRRTLHGAFAAIPEDEAWQNPFEFTRRLGLHGQLFFVFDPEETTHLHRRSFLAVLRELSPLEFVIGARFGVPFALVEEL